jgi:hypothetical protein
MSRAYPSLMPRYSRKSDIDDYLAMFPEVESRWVNRCAACGRRGYKPETPDEAKGAYRIKHDLQPLALDHAGLCEVCASAAARLGNSS